MFEPVCERKDFTMKKSGGKSSHKFIPLNPADIEGEKILLPGRRPCTCEATKHGLVNNCLHCGRIVCDQEGSGPCYTCGNLVCTPKEQEIIMRQSKASMKLYTKLMSQETEIDMNKLQISNDPKMEKALEHRDKLLEYDRTVEKRTKVIDDENDYFQTDSKWLSEPQRKALNKKKKEIDELLHDRKKQTFTLDFAGRKIVEEEPEIKIDVDEILKSDTSIFDYEECSTLEMPNPVYEEQPQQKQYYKAPVQEEKQRLNVRIQDKELQEMSDEGHCLSLHQPHASLLAAGIKLHEGRVWYTSYRGRLWIHAAGKVPTKQEISELENFYSVRTNRDFPKNYPPGCLLGCVDLVDCLPQEEYKTRYPDGVSASPYVFICENARELTIKFPMKGNHKIFKLDSDIHRAAKKTLRKIV
ncbi:hypothetical protein JTE90_016204 [Oedothorax gibbosus]|uniref:Activating signal cointegrator 1 n=1 Tax=Oedothorax gibbosus TaxID=931172 RepID=A0AAV6UL23_9ARAC|nr:hypothetical protein JTE90_016204 [Oedothorax gibbosus]